MQDDDPQPDIISGPEPCPDTVGEEYAAYDDEWTCPACGQPYGHSIGAGGTFSFYSHAQCVPIPISGL